jgi:hypothetical protein
MVQSVTDGNGTTHLFDVINGKSVVGKAMAFVPIGVGMVEQVPMIVYYHGHNGQGSVEGYIKAKPVRDFRPLLKDKKVVFVEPWGGHMSKFTGMDDGPGLTRLISAAMFTAISNGPTTRPCPVNPPPPPALIMAGFSGGGATLKNIVLQSKSASLSLLTEAWCFDCMYSGEGQDWVNWAKSSDNSKKHLRVRVTTTEDTGAPRAQAKIIQATPRDNIDIKGPVELGHEACPGKFIPDFIDRAQADD